MRAIACHRTIHTRGSSAFSKVAVSRPVLRWGLVPRQAVPSQHSSNRQRVPLLARACSFGYSIHAAQPIVERPYVDGRQLKRGQSLSLDVMRTAHSISEAGQSLLRKATSMHVRTATAGLAFLQGTHDILQHSHLIGHSHVDLILPLLLTVGLFKEATSTALAVQRRKGLSRDISVASSMLSVLFAFVKCYNESSCVDPGCDLTAGLLWIAVAALDPLCALFSTADSTVSTATSLAAHKTAISSLQQQQQHKRCSHLETVPDVEDENEGASCVSTPRAQSAATVNEQLSASLSATLTLARTLSNHLPWMAFVGAGAVVVGGDVVRDYMADHFSYFSELNMSWTMMAILMSNLLRGNSHREAKIVSSALVLASSIFHDDTLGALRTGFGSLAILSSLSG